MHKGKEATTSENWSRSHYGKIQIQGNARWSSRMWKIKDVQDSRQKRTNLRKKSVEFPQLHTLLVTQDLTLTITSRRKTSFEYSTWAEWSSNKVWLTEKRRYGAIFLFSWIKYKNFSHASPPLLWKSKVLKHRDKNTNPPFPPRSKNCMVRIGNRQTRTVVFVVTQK